MAREVVRERSAGRAGEVLEGTTGGYKDADVTDGPSASCGAHGRRCERSGAAECRANEETKGIKQKGGSHVVYDFAGRVSNDAGEAGGTRRYRGRDRCSQPEPYGDRGADRIFGKSAGVTHRPEGEPELYGITGAGAGGGVGSVCAPGSAF